MLMTVIKEGCLLNCRNVLSVDEVEWIDDPLWSIC